MIRLSTALTLLAACLLAASAAAQSDQDSGLTVVLPLSLAGDYEHSEALFGSITACGQMEPGMLIYSNSTGCGEIPRDSGYPTGGWPTEQPFILLVDRGDCHFADKSVAAEQAGAVAVIVADNVTERYLPYLADTSGRTGENAGIPTFLIHKADGDAWKACLRGEACSDPSMLVHVTWATPNPEAVVEWELWSTALSTEAARFIRSFSQTSVALKEKARFTPHTWMVDGSIFGCDRPPFTRCGSQCTNSGRYCAFDPDGSVSSGFASGRDVVDENLRSLCTWQLVNETYSQDYGARWWAYQNLFNEHCSQNITQDCSYDQMRAVGIPTGRVSACVQASGGTAHDGPVNSILQAELDLQRARRVRAPPTLFVNGVEDIRSLTAVNVLSDICCGYAPHSQPDACSCLNTHQADLGACVAGDDKKPSKQTDSDSPQGVSLASFALAMTAFAVVFAVIFFFYRRNQKERMRQEVRNILSEYMPLDSMPAGSSSDGDRLMHGAASDASSAI
eukprot:PLAT245.1.p1 GENE.PLAT245.1~~PLAT245.1.p1  ORF type:complete len:506 (-),score=206.01 PLAT245.1:55-1572(-)